MDCALFWGFWAFALLAQRSRCSLWRRDIRVTPLGDRLTASVPCLKLRLNPFFQKRV